MILKCFCEHKAQDEMHGEKMRVFNRRGTTNEYRCTVCGRVVKHIDENKP